MDLVGFRVEGLEAPSTLNHCREEAVSRAKYCTK